MSSGYPNSNCYSPNDKKIFPKFTKFLSCRPKPTMPPSLRESVDSENSSGSSDSTDVSNTSSKPPDLITTVSKRSYPLIIKREPHAAVSSKYQLTDREKEKLEKRRVEKGLKESIPSGNLQPSSLTSEQNTSPETQSTVNQCFLSDVCKSAPFESFKLNSTGEKATVSKVDAVKTCLTLNSHRMKPRRTSASCSTHKPNLSCAVWKGNTKYETATIPVDIDSKKIVIKQEPTGSLSKRKVFELFSSMKSAAPTTRLVTPIMKTTVPSTSEVVSRVDDSLDKQLEDEEAELQLLVSCCSPDVETIPHIEIDGREKVGELQPTPPITLQIRGDKCAANVAPAENIHDSKKYSKKEEFAHRTCSFQPSGSFDQQYEFDFCSRLQSLSSTTIPRPVIFEPVTMDVTASAAEDINAESFLLDFCDEQDNDNEDMGAEAALLSRLIDEYPEKTEPFSAPVSAFVNNNLVVTTVKGVPAPMSFEPDDISDICVPRIISHTYDSENSTKSYKICDENESSCLDDAFSEALLLSFCDEAASIDSYEQYEEVNQISKSVADKTPIVIDDYETVSSDELNDSVDNSVVSTIGTRSDFSTICRTQSEHRVSINTENEIFDVSEERSTESHETLSFSTPPLDIESLNTMSSPICNKFIETAACSVTGECNVDKMTSRAQDLIPMKLATDLQSQVSASLDLPNDLPEPAMLDQCVSVISIPDPVGPSIGSSTPSIEMKDIPQSEETFSRVFSPSLSADCREIYQSEINQSDSKIVENSVIEDPRPCSITVSDVHSIKSVGSVESIENGNFSENDSLGASTTNISGKEIDDSVKMNTDCPGVEVASIGCKKCKTCGKRKKQNKNDEDIIELVILDDTLETTATNVTPVKITTQSETSDGASFGDPYIQKSVSELTSTNKPKVVDAIAEEFRFASSSPEVTPDSRKSKVLFETLYRSPRLLVCRLNAPHLPLITDAIEKSDASEMQVFTKDLGSSGLAPSDTVNKVETKCGVMQESLLHQNTSQSYSSEKSPKAELAMPSARRTLFTDHVEATSHGELQKSSSCSPINPPESVIVAGKSDGLKSETTCSRIMEVNDVVTFLPDKDIERKLKQEKIIFHRALDLELRTFGPEFLLRKQPDLLIKRVDFTSLEPHTIRSLMHSCSQPSFNADSASCSSKSDEWSLAQHRERELQKRGRVLSSDSSSDSDAVSPRHKKHKVNTPLTGNEPVGSRKKVNRIRRLSFESSASEKELDRLCRMPVNKKTRSKRNQRSILNSDGDTEFNIKDEEIQFSADSSIECIDEDSAVFSKKKSTHVTKKLRKSSLPDLEGDSDIPMTQSTSLLGLHGDGIDSDLEHDSDVLRSSTRRPVSNAFNDVSTTDDDCILLDDTIGNPLSQIKKNKRKRLSQIPLLTPNHDKIKTSPPVDKTESDEDVMPHLKFKRRESLLNKLYLKAPGETNSKQSTLTFSSKKQSPHDQKSVTKSASKTKTVYLSSDESGLSSSDEDDYRTMKSLLGPLSSKSKKNGKHYTKKCKKDSGITRVAKLLDDKEFLLSSGMEDSSDGSQRVLSEFMPRKKKIRKDRVRDVYVMSDEDSTSLNTTLSPAAKGRKNIRSIMSEKELKKSTKKAGQEENDRNKRVRELSRDGLYKFVEDENGHRIYSQVWLEKAVNKDKPLVDINQEVVGKLKQHQVEGIQFLYDSMVESVKRARKFPGGGCILAHCMGLGKTLQIVAFLDAVLTSPNLSKCFRKALIISPANTLLNWSREFRKWLGRDCIFTTLNMDNYKQESMRIQVLEKWHTEGGVLIIGYSLFRILVESCSESSETPGPKTKVGAKKPETKKQVSEKLRSAVTKCLLNPGPDFVVCDEGHLLKNDLSSTSKSVNKIRTLRRVILTGTPLQNNLEEYHVMASFVKPHLLGTKKEFRNRFVNPITNGQQKDAHEYDVKLMQRRAHVLHKQLDGCVQRRDYSYITHLLPPKHEFVLLIRLGKLQRDLFSKYLDLFCRNFDQHTQRYMIREEAAKRLFKDYQALSRIWTHPVTLFRVKAFKHSGSSYTNDKSSKEAVKQPNQKSVTLDVAVQSTSKVPAPPPELRNNNDIVCLDDDDCIKTPSGELKSNKRTGLNDLIQDSRSNSPTGDQKLLVDLSDDVLTGDDATRWYGTVKEHFPELRPDLNALPVEWSAKLVVLSDILKMCSARGEKLLIFSQSLISLDLIEDMLKLYNTAKEQSWKIGVPRPDGTIPKFDGSEAGTGSWINGKDYLRLDGSVSSQDRKMQCDIFNAPANSRVRLFLISTRAGSLGINLVAATRVVIFDVCWNPSHDIQSMFRVYRFGQTKPVFIYRLVAQGTMEEKIYNRQVTKQSLSMRVVDENHIARNFTKDEVEELYAFTPDIYDEEVQRSMPNLPSDSLMADLIRIRAEHVFNFHEHDSLLQKDEDEIISEEDKRAAWDEYERERSTPPPQPQPIPGVIPTNGHIPGGLSAASGVFSSNHNLMTQPGNPMLSPFPMSSNFPGSFEPMTAATRVSRVGHNAAGQYPTGNCQQVSDTTSNSTSGVASSVSSTTGQADRGRAYLQSAIKGLTTWAVSSAGATREQTEQHLIGCMNSHGWHMALDNFILAQKLYGTFPTYLTMKLNEGRSMESGETSISNPIHL